MARTIEIKGDTPKHSTELMRSVFYDTFSEVLQIERDGGIIKNIKIEIETINDKNKIHNCTYDMDLNFGITTKHGTQLSPYGKIINFIEKHLNKRLDASFMYELSDLYFKATDPNYVRSYKVCSLEEINQFLKENNAHYQIILKRTYVPNTPYGSEPVYWIVTV